MALHPTGDPPSPDPQLTPPGVRLLNVGPPVVVEFPPDPTRGEVWRRFWLLWASGAAGLLALLWCGGAFEWAPREPVGLVWLLVLGLNVAGGLCGWWFASHLRHVSCRITAGPERVTVEKNGVLGPSTERRTPRPGETAVCEACGQYNERVLYQIRFGSNVTGMTFATGFGRDGRDWAADRINAAIAPPDADSPPPP